ncbi:hypothetical protein LWI28_028435 [Acer negundo]|uniref:Uncharacterized protein n=1 Tax=Acer negundo TaxID=4023 RepID=A0AAD5JI35_ACENE|nr:hypothetical protein LWI28_028435 [Acer negundo]
MSKLNQLFVGMDIEVILSIPISIRGDVDKLVWHYDIKGFYKVKSGYNLALSEKNRLASSGSYCDKKWCTKEGEITAVRDGGGIAKQEERQTGYGVVGDAEEGEAGGGDSSNLNKRKRL